MYILETVTEFLKTNPAAADALRWISVLLILSAYWKLRITRWRKILNASLDYHKFHLAAITGDKNVDEKTREFAQALSWAVTRQLQSDLKDSGGGRALWRSFLGDKTALNTCGTIFYESSRYVRFIDRRIIKLNDTLLGTFYRIYFIESIFSPVALIYMDIFFIISLFVRPENGSGRLYIEMKKEVAG